MKHFLPISALLLGSAILLFAGGINALILPIRGTIEGFYGKPWSMEDRTSPTGAAAP